MPVGVEILGSPTVRVGGVATDLGGQVAGRVLAALAIRAGTRVTTGRLIDDVWGEAAPPRARASLQMHISKLRRLLADTTVGISTVSDGYLLTAPPGTIDLVEFRRLAADARRARDDERWQSAADRSGAALGLWRSDRIEGLDDVASVAGDLSSLHEVLQQTRLIHLEARVALGDHEEAIGALEEAVRAEPFVERLWELLMVALYRSGRQADALAAYRRAERVLAEELGISPGPALARLEERILRQDPGLLEVAVRRAVRPPSIPPPQAPLIDRLDEIEVAIGKTQATRLVCILGPGGVGKTALALEVGRRLTPSHPDGAVVVDLTACSRDRDVARVAAEQHRVGLPDGDPIDGLVEYFGSRSTVLVIDNCEHVAEGAAAMISALLERCRAVSVVATSRRRLGLDPRSELILAPLTAPPAGDPPSRISDYPAVRLFLQRARSMRSDVNIGASDMELVGTICRRVDGLPLAVELIASWVNVLTITDIHDRLGALLESRRLQGHRHESLESTVDWSYQLLGPQERRGFDLLSIFRSTFGLRGASAILGEDDPTTLGILAQLADASLLSVELGGPATRYRMLETIREFGLAQLTARGEASKVAETHRRFVVDTVLAAADDRDEAEWFGEVQLMLPDLRAVLDWADQADPALVVTLADRLRTFWMQRGLESEIEPRLEEVVEGVGSATGWYSLGVMRYARGEFVGAGNAFEAGLAVASDVRDQARLTNALGVLALEAGDYDGAMACYERAERLFEQAGSEEGVAACLLNQGIAAVNRNDPETAERLFESARMRFRRHGNRREEAHALLRLAFTASLAGSPDVALERAHGALRILRTLGPGLALADALQYTADFEIGGGDAIAARSLLVEGVTLFRDLDHPAGLQRSMVTASAIAVGDEQWAEAAEMSAYGAALRRHLGIPVPAANRTALDLLDARITDALPEKRVAAMAERARLADVDGMAARCLAVLEQVGRPV